MLTATPPRILDRSTAATPCSEATRRGPRERVVDHRIERGTVADLADGLERRGQVAAVLGLDRRALPEPGLPGRRADLGLSGLGTRW
jgi:hypothetical protein